MSILDRLEDPEHPLLGPTIKGLKLFRMWQQKTSSPWLIYNWIHIFYNVFAVSQFVELWIIRDDLDLALRNLSLTMLTATSVIKSNSFLYWQKDWTSLAENVSNLEKQQLSEQDQTTASIIKDYTKYSRRITYFYWILVAATGYIVALTPLIIYLASANSRYIMRNGTAPYPEVLSSWLPFDHARGFGYCISVVVHSIALVFGGGVIANYDTTCVVLMSYFKGQLKILSKNCERMFGEKNETISHGEAMKRIKECHNHHVRLVRFSSSLNSLLSPAMFVYVISCSLMICAGAIQIIKESTGSMQRLWIAEYLLALIAQLFLYCWHANEVLQMSNKVEEGVYLSAWWSQNVRIRRSILLLGGQLRKRIVFTAGPFTDLTIPTFVAVIKGSYSYYALLKTK